MLHNIAARDEFLKVLILSCTSIIVTTQTVRWWARHRQHYLLSPSENEPAHGGIVGIIVYANVSLV